MTDKMAIASGPLPPVRVPIPRRGVDYRGTISLAPMVRSGELPSRLLALHHGASLVWGPETIDRALIGCHAHTNTRTQTVDFLRPTDSHDPNSPLSLIYRLHPALESQKLIFQIGSSCPIRAVTAATLVAPYVAGIDLNAGCPKPFSTSSGMGAALLKTPDLLCAILRALVQEVGTKFELGISVKIRLLPDPDDTATLVTALCQTGITGLTIHCRTTPMRPREAAIRTQLEMIGRLCHEAGVACVMNGDVADRKHALQLMDEYRVDGAMIATAAEKNPSVFQAQGRKVGWEEIIRKYMEFVLQVENRYGNTKFSVAQLLPGKVLSRLGIANARGYVEMCEKLGLEALMERAREVDGLLEMANTEKREYEKLKRGKQRKRQEMDEEAESTNKRRKSVGGPGGDGRETMTESKMEEGARSQELGPAVICSPMMATQPMTS